MDNFTKIKKFSLLTFLILLLASCGNIGVIKTHSHTLYFKQGSLIHIESLNCNTIECSKATSELHNRTKKAVMNFITNNSFIISNNSKNADYHFSIISAFENKIHDHMPRNLYLIIRDKNKKELMQFGLSENFSTPIHNNFIALKKVEKKFTMLLVTSIKKVNTFAKNNK